MYRRIKKTALAEIKARNEKFLAEHPGYYENSQVVNEDYEADHSQEIAAAKKGSGNARWRG